MLALGSIMMIAAIALETETPCPSEAAVRASLAGLGVGARERAGAARWELEVDRLHLTVLTASTATIAAEKIDRDIPLGPCVELADQVALVIERATSPLGLLALPPPRTPTAIGVHAGGMILVGGRASGGISAGVDVWPGNFGFGAVLIVQGIPPSRSVFRARFSELTLDVTRWTFGGGLAMRHRFTNTIDAGLTGSVIGEHIAAEPGGGVIASESVDEWRVGFRGGLFGRIALFGPLALSADTHLRYLPERRYRARPATELVVLNSVELEVALSIGAIFF